MTRDWGGLRGIVEEAKELRAEDRQKREIDCPLCGTPLQYNSRDVGNCPMGHYRTQPGGISPQGPR